MAGTLATRSCSATDRARGATPPRRVLAGRTGTRGRVEFDQEYIGDAWHKAAHRGSGRRAIDTCRRTTLRTCPFRASRSPGVGFPFG